MRSTISTTSFTVLLFFAPICFSQALSRADKPDVKVGDSWAWERSDVRTGEKREILHTVTSVTNDRIVVTNEIGEALSYNRDWNLIQVKSGETITSEAKPYWPALQFPLQVGKKWSESYESMARGGDRTFRGQRSMEVIGVETINVPAGKFETFKIRVQGNYNAKSTRGDWSGSWNETLWYSPEAKRNVKRELEDRGREYNNHERAELKSLKLTQ